MNRSTAALIASASVFTLISLITLFCAVASGIHWGTEECGRVSCIGSSFALIFGLAVYASVRFEP